MSTEEVSGKYTREEVSGKFKWFDRRKGFGFITPDNGGPDILVHAVELQQSGFVAIPEAGDEALVIPMKTRRGLKARRVIRVTYL